MLWKAALLYPAEYIIDHYLMDKVSTVPRGAVVYSGLVGLWSPSGGEGCGQMTSTDACLAAMEAGIVGFCCNACRANSAALSSI